MKKFINFNSIILILLLLQFNLINFTFCEKTETNIKNPDIEFINAVKNNDINKSKELLNNNVINVNYKDNLNNYAINYAVLNKNKELVELLLKKGANVNALGRDGIAPIIEAIEVNSPEIADILLKYKADPNAENLYRETALVIAGINCNEPIFENLLRYTKLDLDKIEHILKYCRDKNSKIYKKLSKELNYYNAIINAIKKNNNNDLTKLLRNIGKDYKEKNIYNGITQILNYKDNLGNIPLSYANYNNYALIENLLLNGAKDQINIPDKNGNTILLNIIKATDNKNSKNIEKIVTKLLENGADPNIENYYRETAFTYAVEKGLKNIVELFCKYKAFDKLIKNNEEENLIKIARDNNHKEIESLLNKHKDLKTLKNKYKDIELLLNKYMQKYKKTNVKPVE